MHSWILLTNFSLVGDNWKSISILNYNIGRAAFIKLSGLFALIIAIALAFLSLIALIVSVILLIFGNHPHQKYIAYAIGSGTCLIISVIYALLIEKTQHITIFSI